MITKWTLTRLPLRFRFRVFGSNVEALCLLPPNPPVHRDNHNLSPAFWSHHFLAFLFCFTSTCASLKNIVNLVCSRNEVKKKKRYNEEWSTKYQQFHASTHFSQFSKFKLFMYYLYIIGKKPKMHWNTRFNHRKHEMLFYSHGWTISNFFLISNF